MTPEPTSIPQERGQMVKVGAWILEVVNSILKCILKLS